MGQTFTKNNVYFTFICKSYIITAIQLTSRALQEFASAKRFIHELRYSKILFNLLNKFPYKKNNNI